MYGVSNDPAWKFSPKGTLRPRTSFPSGSKIWDVPAMLTVTNRIRKSTRKETQVSFLRLTKASPNYVVHMIRRAKNHKKANKNLPITL